MKLNKISHWWDLVSPIILDERLIKFFHLKILPEFEKWVDKKIYPEIIEVCKEIMKNESILIGDFKEITKVKRENFEGSWQEKVLQGNLFQKENGNLRFQNRATKQFVKEFLEK
jgi:hypothetical protein